MQAEIREVVDSHEKEYTAFENQIAVNLARTLEADEKVRKSAEKVL